MGIRAVLALFAPFALDKRPAALRVPGDKDFLERSEHEEEQEIAENWLSKEFPEFRVVKYLNWEQKFSPFYIFRIWTDDLCVAEIINRGNSADVVTFLQGWKAHERKVKDQ